MKKNWCLIAATLLTPILSIADDDAKESTSTAVEQKDKTSEELTLDEQMTSRQTDRPVVPYVGDLESDKKQWDHVLPFLGEAATERGYVLPLPFGLSIGGLTQSQPFQVNSVDFNSQTLQNAVKTVDMHDLKVSDDTVNLRLDAWIFPFLSVYGVVGKNYGTVEGLLDICATTRPGPDCDGRLAIDLKDLPVKLKYHGTVVGGGTTLAGGYKDFFAMIDYNYTSTDISISTVDAIAKVTSARIGWNGKLGWWNGSLWLGAMQEDVAQVIEVVVPELVIDGEVLKVSVDQETEKPINYVLGGRYAFSPSYEIIFEYGTTFQSGGREQFMLTGSYRF